MSITRQYYSFSLLVYDASEARTGVKCAKRIPLKENKGAYSKFCYIQKEGTVLQRAHDRSQGGLQWVIVGYMPFNSRPLQWVITVDQINLFLLKTQVALSCYLPHIYIIITHQVRKQIELIWANWRDQHLWTFISWRQHLRKESCWWWDDATYIQRNVSMSSINRPNSKTSVSCHGTMNCTMSQ